MNIIEDLQERVKEEHIKEPAECRQLLIDIIKKQMEVDETAYEYENRTSVVLVIGVNGVGKTTTIGKLAAQLKSQNKKVIMAAADTFRAAAIEQLTEWSNRAGVDIIAQQEGSDPAAVIYDACQAAKSRHADVLLCDTAGRLHNKKNLTKLDGTAKGGIAIEIQAELGIPVKYIGIGEKIEDLQKFDADSFVNALFEKPAEDEE